MTDEEKAKRIFSIENLSFDEGRERLIELDNKKQVDLTEIEKSEYLILKWKVEGKVSFFEDSYICKLLQELILLWIEDKRDIPDLFPSLFYMTHVDWLIDWKKTEENAMVVRQDIVDNMHTFINPFLEEIEEILGESYKSREKTNLKDRIINDIESLVNYQKKNKIPLIYNALFKVKYALQGAREYMKSNKKKSIILNSTEFKLDIQSIAHIFLRHTHRFKTLTHKDNRGKRGFINNELGNEYEELDKILKAIEANATITPTGVIICQVSKENYKMVIKTGRIVTLYPIE